MSLHDIYQYLTVQLKTNQFFSAAFVGSLITGSFIYLKAVPAWIWSKIIRHTSYTITIYQNDRFFYLFEDWFNKKYPQTYRNVQVKYEDKNIKYEQESVNVWFWYKNRYIQISNSKERIDNASSVTDRYFSKYTIFGIFAKKQLQSLIKEVYDSEEKNENKLTIRILYNNGGAYSIYVNPKPLHKVIINEKIKSDLISYIDNFKNGQKWYNDRQVRYKTGILLEGEPGNGKTSLALSIAQHLGYQYLSVNLADLAVPLDNISSQCNQKFVIVFEDIDVCFNMRESSNPTVSFDSMLKILDGYCLDENIIIILTTNHIEKLDPALIRAGRIDKIVNIPNPSIVEVNEYLNVFYNTNISLEKYTKTLCMAEIQNICLTNKDDINKTIEILSK